MTPCPVPQRTSPLPPCWLRWLAALPWPTKPRPAPQRAGNAIERAAQATGRGLKRGVEATSHGVQVAVKATEHGLSRAGTAVEHGTHKAADKVRGTFEK